MPSATLKNTKAFKGFRDVHSKASKVKILVNGNAIPLKELSVGTTGVHRDNGELYTVGTSSGKTGRKVWIKTRMYEPLDAMDDEAALKKFLKHYKGDTVKAYRDAVRKGKLAKSVKEYRPGNNDYPGLDDGRSGVAYKDLKSSRSVVKMLAANKKRLDRGRNAKRAAAGKAPLKKQKA